MCCCACMRLLSFCGIVAQYPEARPFPSKRRNDYQHVGQVFDAHDNPRMGDIDRFIKNREVPKKCRRKSEWKFG